MASGKPVKEKNVWRVNGPTDFENIYQLVGQLDEEFKKKHPYFRLAYLTLSSSITQADEREAMSFVQRLVNRLRQTKAVSAIALERGMHTDQTLEALEHMVDGAIHFKSDKQKTALQVVGLGEVQKNAASRGDQERDEEDRADQKGPRHEGERRIPAEIALPEDRVEGRKDRGRDDGQGAFRRAERELAFRANEEDHDRKAGEGDGDSGGWQPPDALLQEGNCEDCDERRSRGNDQGGGARADFRIRFSEVQEEMVARESEEGHDDEHWNIVPRWRVSDLASDQQIDDDEHICNGESEEGERDPRHVGEGLLDRNEGEPPKQNQDNQGGVQGPAAVARGLERHIRGSGKRDKKMSPAFDAGGRFTTSTRSGSRATRL